MYGAAIEESGHAVVAEALGLRVVSVSIEENGDGLCVLEPEPAPPRPSDLGPARSREEIAALVRYAASVDPDPRALDLQGLRPDADLRDHLVHSMAGRIAHARVAGEAAALRGAESDLACERMISTIFSDRVNVGLEMANARGIAEALVTKHWPAILAVASALLDRRKLTGDQVRLAIGRKV